MTQKWTEQKEELDKSTVIFGHFNIALPTKSSSCSSYEIRQKITKGVEELSSINKIDLNGISSTLYPWQQNTHSFQNSRHVHQDRLDCMLNHEAVLNKFKSTEIMQSTLFDNSRTKLEIRNKMVIPEYLEIKQHTSK